MSVNEHRTVGAKVEVDLEELHDGARQILELSEEIHGKLTPSDCVLPAAIPAWKGLNSSALFSEYAESEIQHGKSLTEAVENAANNTRIAAQDYEQTDARNADTLTARPLQSSRE